MPHAQVDSSPYWCLLAARFASPIHTSPSERDSYFSVSPRLKHRGVDATRNARSAGWGCRPVASGDAAPVTTNTGKRLAASRREPIGAASTILSRSALIVSLLTLYHNVGPNTIKFAPDSPRVSIDQPQFSCDQSRRRRASLREDECPTFPPLQLPS